MITHSHTISLSTTPNYWVSKNEMILAHLKAMKVATTKLSKFDICYSRACMYLAGFQFGNYRLKRDTPIAFEISPNSVVATLIYPNISDSGENEDKALKNLGWYISDLLDEQKANQGRSLGRRFAEQIKILEELFERAHPNH